MVSQLSLQLLLRLAMGTLAATDVQAIAGAAWADQGNPGRAGDRLLGRLAGAGKRGKFPGNCLRDVMRAAEAAGLMDSMYRPYLAHVRGADNEQIEVRIFLPHENLHRLVELQDEGLHTWCLTDEDRTTLTYT